MVEKPPQLMSENNSPFIRDTLFKAFRELEQQFPGSKFTVIISPVDQGKKPTKNQRIFFGPLDHDGNEQPVFYASTIKPAMITVVAEETTKRGISPNHLIESTSLNPQESGKRYSSLRELIRLALGPSNNAAFDILMKYLGELVKESGKSPQDFVQARMDELLGAESLLTINNSPKEQKTGLWNAGRLSELMTIFSMILNKDPSLEVSDEYLTLMIKTMEEEFADPVIELGQRVKRKGLFPNAQFVGKSGYFHDLDVLPNKPNSMDALIQNNGWDPALTSKATYILDMERAISDDGKMFDLAIAIGIPHNVTNNDMLQEQKIQASEIVMDRIILLLDSLF